MVLPRTHSLNYVYHSCARQIHTLQHSLKIRYEFKQFPSILRKYFLWFNSYIFYVRSTCRAFTRLALLPASLMMIVTTINLSHFYMESSSRIRTTSLLNPFSDTIIAWIPVRGSSQWLWRNNWRRRRRTDPITRTRSACSAPGAPECRGRWSECGYWRKCWIHVRLTIAQK